MSDDPHGYEADEICTRCRERIGREDYASRVAICSPHFQHRSPEYGLCSPCASLLWEFLDLHRPESDVDFVLERVEEDLLMHPRTAIGEKWVRVHVRPTSPELLLGGIAITQVCRPLARFHAEHVVRMMTRDGLRVAGDPIGEPYG